MERVLSIYLPAWDVQLLQRPPSVRPPCAPPDCRRPALLLISTHARQQIVVRCCARAAAAGISPGLTLAEARALCPAARVLPFESDKSARALALLAHWCQRFSPTVALDPVPFQPSLPENISPSPDGLLLDITGEEHLFGSEQLLLYEFAARLRRLGFTARLAAAPTVGAAWALARCASEPLSVLEAPRLREALAPLPLIALRLPPGIRQRLHHVGITTIADLLAIPRENLLSRFGPDLLLRLDQLFSRVPESFTPIHPVIPLQVQRAFDGPAIQIQAITLTVQDLLQELSELLLQQESGIRALTVQLTRSNAQPVSRQILLSRPSRDPKHLWSLLRDKVQSLHLGFGVEAVTVSATWIEKILHQQLQTFQDPRGGEGGAAGDADHHVAQLLDTLLNRWGPKRIFQALPVDSHLPERARQFQPISASQDIDTSAHRPTPLFYLDRPSLLLDRPEAAEALALIPDHPPAWLRWRAQEHSLRTGLGPERIVTTWWPPPSSPSSSQSRLSLTPSTRDYFKVQNSEGLWLWVFRELETGHWFVHGLWI